jgi:hypothetical protein
MVLFVAFSSAKMNLNLKFVFVDFFLFFQQLKYYILLLLFNMQKDHN